MDAPKPRLRRVVVVTTALALMGSLALAVSASHSFLDVSEDHLFHDDIEWMKDNDITRGCNPPANTQYCPEELTTRGQMAAFFHRFARSQSVDAGFLEGHTSDEFLLKEEVAEHPELQGPQGPPGESASFSSDNIVVREASEAEGNLVVVGNNYTAMCEPGEIAISGGYETDFTLAAPLVDDLLGPLSGVLSPLGLGDIGDLGDALNGVSNVNVHTHGPTAAGDGWTIGTTINLASEVTVRAVCVG